MKKILFLFVLALAVAACEKADIGPSSNCSYTADPAYARHPKAQLLQGIVDKYIRKGLPGMSVYVRDSSGVWVGAGGKADVARNIPFQPCTVSKVASITKMFVGTLTHLLIEEGKLRLDDKVDAYLPGDVLDKVKNCRGATIRQLMNHTTGIYDVITDNSFYLAVLNNPDKHWSATELLKYVNGKDPYFPLGTSCYYSNTNTLLLSMVIEKATGRPHADLVREKVLQPLGLSNTFYYSHDVLPPFTAQGYYDLYNNGTISNVTNFNTGSGNGFGGMFSTVFDLARFAEALLKDKTILKASSLAEMEKFVEEIDPDTPDNDLYLGAGLMKRYFNQPENSLNYGYGHTGRDLGYNANCFYFPNQNTTLCFIVNYGTNGDSRLKDTFFDLQGELTDLIVKK